MTLPPTSPRWSSSTKFLVSSAFLVLIAWLLLRFQEIIGALIFTFIFAYLLSPVVRAVESRFKLKWSRAVAVTYAVLGIVLIGALIALGVAAQQQIVGLYRTVVEISKDIPAFVEKYIQQPLEFGPFQLDPEHLDLQPFYDQLTAIIEPVLSQAGAFVSSATGFAATGLGWLLFVLIVSFYLLMDVTELPAQLEEQMVPPAYRSDLRRLAGQLGPIWDAFLRGQTLLAVGLGIVYGIALTILGVKYAPVLGLLAMAMEFIPYVGATVTLSVSLSIALFQGGNWMGLSPVTYAGVIIIMHFAFQSIQSNFFYPRIIGRSLELHPIIILVGALVMAQLVGVVGLFLAAPLIASLRLFGRYAYRKLFDLDPWADTLAPSEPIPPTLPAQGEVEEAAQV